ncbi:hypothetical protein P9112_004626 [Eukaryota sp. TZLM1-RC]
MTNHAAHLQEINTVEQKRFSSKGDTEAARQQARLEEEEKLSAQVQVWLEAVLEHQFEGSWIEECRDGQLLCKLINIISPGTIKRIHKFKQAFMSMENIQAFVKGCEKLGLDESLFFEPVDLYELRNKRKVILCVYELAYKTTNSGFKIKLRSLDATNSSVNDSMEKLRQEAENADLSDDVELQKTEYEIDSSLLTMPEDEEEVPEGAMVSFTLNIDIDDEENVKLVGSTDKLGNWDIDQGLALEERDLGQWGVNIENPPANLTFKFVKIDEEGEVVWEAGCARRLVLDSTEMSSTVEYIGTWRHSDDAEDHVMRLVLEDGSKVLFNPIYDTLKGSPDEDSSYDRNDLDSDDKNVEIGKGGLAGLVYTDSTEGAQWTGSEWETVVSLDLDYCWLNDASLTALIEKVPNLSRLDISGCEDVTDGLLEFLGNNRPTLTELVTERCRNLSGKGVTHLTDKATAMEKLCMSRCRKLEDAELSAFVEKFGQTIFAISVAECKRLSDEFLTKLSQCCPNLTELNIGETAFSSNAIENVVADKCLVSFEANGCLCETKVLELLAEFSAPTLKTLNLHWTNVGAGIEHLSQFQSLTALDISNVEGIEDEKLALFAESPSMETIEELALGNLENVSDETLSKLVYAAAATLIAVTFTGTQCGDLTVEALGQTKIQTVNVSDCENISDSVCNLSLVPQLQVLNVRKCHQVSSDCLRKFGEMRPESSEVTVQEVSVELGSNADDVDDEVCEDLNSEFGEKSVEKLNPVAALDFKAKEKHRKYDKEIEDANVDRNTQLVFIAFPFSINGRLSVEAETFLDDFQKMVKEKTMKRFDIFLWRSRIQFAIINRLPRFFNRIREALARQQANQDFVEEILV